MRHKKNFNHLGRKVGHRKALLKNLSIALITHKRINTTLAKAKALRRHVEPLITKAKTNTTHSRRTVFSYLQDKVAMNELFGNVIDKVGSRPGGYVRIIKTGFRRSDAAEMAMIELVDFNDAYTNAKGDKAKAGKKSRRRGGKKKSSAGTATKAAATAAATTAGTTDDLKIVEGIGPKIEEILNAKGITTLAALGAANVDTIKEALTEAGGRFSSHDPTTWPQQAQMAADGKWDELKKWQDELDGGKVVSSSEEE